MTGASSGANFLRKRLGRLSGPVAFDVFSDDKERATSPIEIKKSSCTSCGPGWTMGTKLSVRLFMYQLRARMDNEYKIIGKA